MDLLKITLSQIFFSYFHDGIIFGSGRGGYLEFYGILNQLMLCSIPSRNLTFDNLDIYHDIYDLYQKYLQRGQDKVRGKLYVEQINGLVSI